MDNSPLPPTPPTTVNRTMRRPNAELRTREHLTTQEVEALIEAAGANRQGHRDALMILLAFRHGLRASEVCDLRWEQIDFKAATLHVRRTKNGTPATHPLTGRELRGLRRHQREAPGGAFVFVSERGALLSAPGFSRMVERAGLTAKLGIKVHAHMLRLVRPSQPRPRYPRPASLSRPRQYPKHNALHGLVQRVLAGLTQASPGGTVGKPKGFIA